MNWANPQRNEWLAVNQFSIKGPHHTRRPDIIRFVNGLPLVRGLLAPRYLLDYLRYFVLFEDVGGIVKKIAGYHQFHAVRLAIGQVLWHTQGSGKSITMTCFAARVMQEPAMENPTIVVIADEANGTQFGFAAKLKARK